MNNQTKVKAVRAVSKEVSVPTGEVILKGKLVLPADARGLVIFVHGSGSSRFSPRNNQVADIINEHGYGTFLFDLLSEQEDRIYSNRFDIHLLAERLLAVTGWIMGQEETRGIPIAYFGASTGAAAALTAAAKLGYVVKAVVSRGGRTDLSLSSPDQIMAGVLMIAGDRDPEIIAINKRTFEKLACEKEIRIIKGAGHLFEEPGKMNEVAAISTAWFGKYFEKEKDE